MSKTTLQKHIEKLSHYYYLIQVLHMYESSEELLSRIIKDATDLLEEEKKQTIDFAHMMVNKWSMMLIPKETIEDYYKLKQTKKKVRAIQFDGTIEKANKIIKFTNGNAWYTQTKETLETEKVTSLSVGLQVISSPGYYVIEERIEGDSPIYNVISEDYFDENYEIDFSIS